MPSSTRSKLTHGLPLKRVDAAVKPGSRAKVACTASNPLPLLSLHKATFAEASASTELPLNQSFRLSLTQPGALIGNMYPSLSFEYCLRVKPVKVNLFPETVVGAKPTSKIPLLSLSTSKSVLGTSDVTVTDSVPTSVIAPSASAPTPELNVLTFQIRLEAWVAPPGRPPCGAGLNDRLLSLRNRNSLLSKLVGSSMRITSLFTLCDWRWLRPLPLSIPIPKILFL